MRKVDVVRPPINYAITHTRNIQRQVAWFVDLNDAEDFLGNMLGGELYEIVEARR